MTGTLSSEQQAILAMPPEAYMNSQQLEFFLRLLSLERSELIVHIDYLKTQLERSEQHGDEADNALREEELRLLFR